MITSDIIKVFIPATASFAIGILCAPLLTHYLFKYKVWKKTAGKTALDGTPAVEFEKLRTTVHTGTETKTPRMGGILIWASVMIGVRAVTGRRRCQREIRPVTPSSSSRSGTA